MRKEIKAAPPGAADALMRAFEEFAKPVDGAVLVAVAGEVISPDAFSVDPENGIVTLDLAPAGSAIVTAGFVFDTPVRFDLDRLDLAIDGFGAGHAVAIPLLEIRL